MDLSFLMDYCTPVILAACLVVGYCIKHVSWLDKISNEYIPTLMAFLGMILSIPVQMSAGDPVTVQSIVAGAVTGLASTGLHQAFKHLIKKEGE